MIKSIYRNNLQELRQRANYTQVELAKRIGVSTALVRKYEQQQQELRKASWITIVRMEEVLRCRWQDLMTKDVLLEVDELVV